MQISDGTGARLRSRITIVSIKNRIPLAIVLLLGFLIGGCASNATQMSPRKDTLIDTGWNFIRQDVPDAQRPQFDDSRWQSVTLPHTWNALDGQDGGSNYYRGPAWYRLHLTIDPADLHKEIFLRFEAASLTAQVYVNGQFAGAHRGGFAAFCLDISHLIQSGDNVIAVRVDNSHFTDIPPLFGDFTVCGGLYRNVHLLILNPLSISPTDDASPGVYLTPSHVDSSTARVRITTELRNDSSDDQPVSARSSISDSTGKVVAAGQVDQRVRAHSTAEAVTSLVITNPHLWNGRADPYLYRATVDLLHAGQIVDRVVQPLGLRYFRVDPQAGFFLNGRSYPLHGVSVHQDYLNKGWAIQPADIDTDYQLVNEMGCTVVRLAHYQHPDYEYTICDHSGIAVWAEIPLVNRIADSAAFSDNAKQQLRELIKQNYNHPSICFWSLFNELGPRTRTDWQLVNDLNDLAHQLDPHRVTVAASHLPASISVNWIPDIIGFNRYFGWYTGAAADWPLELDKLHDAFPDRAIGISEYGAGASISQHQQNPTTHPSTKGNWHPEEWQSIVHERAYAAMKQRPWLWGTFVWNMFDFACDDRDEGDQPGRNDKGLVTIDRAVKKDAFYFYKANWSADPFVHITSARFNPHPPGPATVKVYSNCPTVQLIINGHVVSTQSSADHIFIWPNVALSAGLCQVQAIGEQGGHRYTDSIAWTGSPE